MMLGVPPEWIIRLQDFAYYGALGGFSAVVGFLYRTIKHEHIPFSWPAIIISALVGWYMGMMVAGLIPSHWDQQHRDSVVLLIGATGIKGFEAVVESSAISKIKILFK